MTPPAPMTIGLARGRGEGPTELAAFDAVPMVAVYRCEPW